MNDDNPYETTSIPDTDAEVASSIEPSYSSFEEALLSRLAFHMSGTDMSAENIEKLGRVFVQRIEAKMIRLRDGQLKHGGDFLVNVDHLAERRQEMDDAEWYDIGHICNSNTNITIKLS